MVEQFLTKLDKFNTLCMYAWYENLSSILLPTTITDYLQGEYECYSCTKN